MSAAGGGCSSSPSGPGGTRLWSVPSGLITTITPGAFSTSDRKRCSLRLSAVLVRWMRITSARVRFVYCRTANQSEATGRMKIEAPETPSVR